MLKVTVPYRNRLNNNWTSVSETVLRLTDASAAVTMTLLIPCITLCLLMPKENHWNA
jgi:hypothetical protein